MPLTFDLQTRILGNVDFSKRLEGMSQLTIDRTSQPGEGQAWQDLQALLAQRIDEGLSGGVTDKSIAAILDEELGRDGHVRRSAGEELLAQLT